MNLECRGCIWFVKIYDKRTPIPRVIFTLSRISFSCKERKKERTNLSYWDWSDKIARYIWLWYRRKQKQESKNNPQTQKHSLVCQISRLFTAVISYICSFSMILWHMPQNNSPISWDNSWAKLHSQRIWFESLTCNKSLTRKGLGNRLILIAAFMRGFFFFFFNVDFRSSLSYELSVFSGPCVLPF